MERDDGDYHCIMPIRLVGEAHTLVANRRAFHIEEFPHQSWKSFKLRFETVPFRLCIIVIKYCI